jgi:HlyD family secretion protein
VKRPILYGLFTLALLLIAINLFVFYKYEEKIDRTTIVKKIARVTTTDFRETLSKNGMVTSEHVQEIYHDPKLGEIDAVLVKQGEMVEKGTPIIQYRNDDLESEKSLLDQKIENTKNKIQRIEDSIQQLRKKMNEEKDDEKNESNTSHYELLISDKEFQKLLFEQELEEYEEKKRTLENKEEKLTVKSSISGIVRQIGTKPDHPVVTVVSAPFQVKGTLTDQEYPKVMTGQKANITTTAYPDKAYKGTVEHVSEFPENEPTLKNKASTYPFTVQLDEEAESLKYGFHVKIDIITKEHNDALSIPSSAITKKDKNRYVFVLNKGKLDKRSISLGTMKNGKLLEVQKGIKEGEFIALEPTWRFADNNNYVTPITYKALTKQTFKSLSNKEKITYMLKGLLHQ